MDLLLELLLVLLLLLLLYLPYHVDMVYLLCNYRGGASRPPIRT